MIQGIKQMYREKTMSWETVKLYRESVRYSSPQARRQELCQEDAWNPFVRSETVPFDGIASADTAR